jgi:aspartate/methionine/tyrosine aminotransferase
MTGWRLGATVGPQDLIDIIIKLNVNDESCSNHFVQYAALEGLTGDQTEMQNNLAILQTRRDRAAALLNDIEGIDCLVPDVTFYLYPNVTGAMQAKGFKDYEAFRRDLLHNIGVSFCTREHFGRVLPGEDQYFIRIAYSAIELEAIEEGLQKLKVYLEN